jgi:hypothetical protein
MSKAMTLRTLHHHPRLVRYSTATIVYAALTAVAFHGILVHPGSHLVSGFGDGTDSLRSYWAASTLHRNPFDFTFDPFLNAPEGVHQAAAGTLANGGLQTAFVWETKGALGLVGAWNTFMLLGFVATGIAMFALLERLGCTFSASLLGGYLFAFSTYSISHVKPGHLSFVQNWVLVAVAAGCLALGARLTWRYALATGVALAIAFYLSAYEGLFASVMVFVLFCVHLFRVCGRRPRLRLAALTLASYLVAVVAITPMFVLYVRDRTIVDLNGTRSTATFYRLAASFSDYLLPSSRDAFFRWLPATESSRPVEEDLYFGYLTWVLALAAVVLVIRRDPWLRASRGRWWAAIAFAVLVPAAILMSLPPRVHLLGLAIPTPPVAIEAFTSQWRAYSRFGIVACFALTALAALALTALRRRGGRVASVIYPLALLALFLEMLPGNIHAFDATHEPGWVAWLRSKPQAIMATYPFLGPGEKLEEDRWWQIYDRDPEFASYSGTQRQQGIRFLARDIWRPITARVLAAEGVRYAVVHEDATGPLDLDPKQYTLVERSGPVQIFTVHAKPIDLTQALRGNAVELASLAGFQPTVSYRSGFNTAEQFEGRTSRWMIQDGELDIDAARHAMQITLTGAAFSNGVPRLLEVETADGRILARQEIPTDAVRLSLGPFLVPAGTTRLRLVARPGPARLGAGDPRRASVFIEPLTPVPMPTYTARPGTPRA